MYTRKLIIAPQAINLRGYSIVLREIYTEKAIKITAVNEIIIEFLNGLTKITFLNITPSINIPKDTPKEPKFINKSEAMVEPSPDMSKVLYLYKVNTFGEFNVSTDKIFIYTSLP